MMIEKSSIDRPLPLAPPFRFTLFILSLSVFSSMILYGCSDEAIVSIQDPLPPAIDVGVEMQRDIEVDDPIELDMTPPQEDLAPPPIERDMMVIVDMQPIVDPPRVPVRVEVKLGSEVTAAGVLNRISCLAYDESGLVLSDSEVTGEPNFDVRPLNGWTTSESDPQLFQGLITGVYRARCELPLWGLRSEQRSWRVIPGPPWISAVTLSDERVRAGTPVDALCEVRDERGNLIEVNDPNVEREGDAEGGAEGGGAEEGGAEGGAGDPLPLPIMWRVTPAEGTMAFEDGALTLTRSGEYEVSCSVLGAPEQIPSALTISPNLPATLLASIQGERFQYSLNDVITFNYDVLDRYDNQIPNALVTTRVTPNLPSFGERRVHATEAGTFTALVEVSSETEGGRRLAQSLTFNVDDGAPQLECTSPQVGEMRGLSAFYINGHVEDVSGLDEVRVDGALVSVDGDGDFRARVTPQWGLNMHELTARDSLGELNSAVCFYFASATYLPESLTISDSALLHLGQNAIDDGAPRTPKESLGDLLYGVLNSDELIDTIDDALEAQNPIVPLECRSRIFGACIFSAGVDYDDISAAGPHSVSLDLIEGGLNVSSTLRNLTLDITARGQTGFSWSQSGSVSISSVSVSIDLNISRIGATPRVTVRGEPSVTLGDINLSLNISLGIAQSLINSFVNVVLNQFEGIIRNQISSQLGDFLKTQFDSVLSDILQSLDLSDIGLNLSIPNFFGGAATTLGLSFSLNRMEANNTRLRVGLSGRVTGSQAHSRISQGVPSPSGSRTIELSPGFGNDSAGAAHLTILNSVLHRLWRAGLFDVADASSVIGGGVDGPSISFLTLTPPALSISGPGARAKLHFGPALAQVTYPGLIDDPISIYMGAYGRSTISLVGGSTLNFGDIIIEDLTLSTMDLPLSPQARSALENTFQSILQSLFDQALNDALPDFPIPDFALPSSLSSYGIPIGTRLGVRDLSLSQNGSSLIVKGDFGL
jgi:hypothetical protein